MADKRVMQLKLLALLATLERRRRRLRHRMCPRYQHAPPAFQELLDPLTDRTFRMRYRVTFRVFKMICQKMKQIGFRKPNTGRGRKSKHSREARVAMTLRFLAGGSYLDLCDIYKTSERYMYLMVADTCEWLVKAYPMPLLSEPAVQQAARASFRRKPGGAEFDGAIMAIDGVCLRIVAPSTNASQYYNRKGYFALNMQAGVDGDARFLWTSIITSGGTHDALAFACSPLSRWLERGGLPAHLFILGDEASAASPQVLTPFSGRNLPVEHDSFNFFQVS
jgi:hypothetical protein